MSKLEIGVDIYNREVNRMGMVCGFTDTHATVRSTRGHEVWELTACDVMTDEFDNDVEHEECVPWK